MEPRAGWALRYARAAVLSSGAVGLAAVAHVSAGGLLPDLTVFALMLVACTLISGTRLGREASRWEIVALLVGGQTAMHAAMTAISGHGDPAEAEPSGLGHSLVHALEHLAEDMTWHHAPMMLAHLAAAAVVGLWLAYGERALWSLIRLVAAEVTALLAVPRVVVVPRIKALPERFAWVPAVRQVALASTHLRRGPPAYLRAA